MGLDYSFGTTKKRCLLNVNIEKNDTENIFTPSQSAEVWSVDGIYICTYRYVS